MLQAVGLIVQLAVGFSTLIVILWKVVRSMSAFIEKHNALAVDFEQHAKEDRENFRAVNNQLQRLHVAVAVQQTKVSDLGERSHER